MNRHKYVQVQHVYVILDMYVCDFRGKHQQRGGRGQVCPLREVSLNSVGFFYIPHLMCVYISGNVGGYLQVVRLHSSKYSI